MNKIDSRFVETSDGSYTLRSNDFGVTYHSIHGAIEEGNHVFINAGLRHKAVLDNNLSILEIGMGTGLNALLTYSEALKRGLSIYYHAVEAFPITTEEAKKLDYGNMIKPNNPIFFENLHTSNWQEEQLIGENFSFFKEKTKFQEIETDKRFDIIYFDAFAPTAQPELWTEEIFEKMYTLLKPKGVLVTYCAQGAFKRTLKKVGFEVEKLKGPPGKREMTRGLKLH